MRIFGAAAICHHHAGQATKDDGLSYCLVYMYNVQLSSRKSSALFGAVARHFTKRRMRDSLLVLLAAGTMQAAVIRGVVVEHSTGKPLARSQLVVAPLPGTPGQPRALRSNTYGNF